MKNQNNDDFSEVNLRRMQLQEDLNVLRDDVTAEIEETMEHLEGLQNALKEYEWVKGQSKEEHVNVLFEKQQASAKDTGKMASPENIKKVIDDFYEKGLDSGETIKGMHPGEVEALAEMCTRKKLMDDFEIIIDLDKLITDEYCLRNVSPIDKVDINQTIQMLLDRAFDAGILAGIALYVKSRMIDDADERREQEFGYPYW